MIGIGCSCDRVTSSNQKVLEESRQLDQARAAQHTVHTLNMTFCLFQYMKPPRLFSLRKSIRFLYKCTGKKNILFWNLPPDPSYTFLLG